MSDVATMYKLLDERADEIARLTEMLREAERENEQLRARVSRFWEDVELRGVEIDRLVSRIEDLENEVSGYEARFESMALDRLED